MVRETYFPAPLNEIVTGIADTIAAVSEEYPPISDVGQIFFERLVEKRISLQNNILGRLYREWQDAPNKGIAGNEAWRRFVIAHGEAQAKSPDGKVFFSDYPGLAYFELPRFILYKPPAYIKADMISVQKSGALQRGFARVLGILGEGESWEDLVRSPQIQSVERDDYKGARVLFKGNPEILVRMDHEDINMLELPLAPSKKYPGVVADIKFYQEEKEPIVPIEQLVVADKGTFVAMSVFLSGHLFTESNFANLQTPAGKDQFLSALCRLP